MMKLLKNIKIIESRVDLMIESEEKKVIYLNNHNKKNSIYEYNEEQFIDDIVEEIVKEQEANIDELTNEVLSRKNKK